MVIGIVPWAILLIPRFGNVGQRGQDNVEVFVFKGSGEILGDDFVIVQIVSCLEITESCSLWADFSYRHTMQIVFGAKIIFHPAKIAWIRSIRI